MISNITGRGGCRYDPLGLHHMPMRRIRLFDAFNEVVVILSGLTEVIGDDVCWHGVIIFFANASDHRCSQGAGDTNTER
jgi:hypothetical protein